MADKNLDLIHELTQRHQKKPFWKNRHFLLVFWFFFNVMVYAALALSMGENKITTTTPYIIINILASLLSWGVFSTYLNHIPETKKGMMSVLGLLFLVLGALMVENMAGGVSHQRHLSVTESDWTCMRHVVAFSMTSVIAFVFWIKNFFIGKPGWAALFMSTHLSLLSLLVLELKCHDKEFWHLLIGHQSSYFLIFGVISILWALKKKITSLKT